MRLWHKDLIQVLPRQQLLSQWRECCCIANYTNNKDSMFKCGEVLEILDKLILESEE